MSLTIGAKADCTLVALRMSNVTPGTLGHWRTSCFPPGSLTTFALTDRGVQFQVRVEFAMRLKLAEVPVPVPAALPVPDHPVQRKAVPFVAADEGTLMVTLVPCGNQYEP